MAKNKLKDFKEVLKTIRDNCPKLETLWLEGNPLHPGREDLEKYGVFRARCKIWLAGLERLDWVTYSAEDYPVIESIKNEELDKIELIYFPERNR